MAMSGILEYGTLLLVIVEVFELLLLAWNTWSCSYGLNKEYDSTILEQIQEARLPSTTTAILFVGSS